MVTALKPLANLTAADLMKEDVLAIPRVMSLQAAGRLFSLHQVSGAPVVDARGRCVGVLSATDFVRWVGHPEAHCKPTESAGDGVWSPWQILDSEAMPEDAVCHFMTVDPIKVPPSMPLREIARLLIDAHIHRVIVVDEENCPRGIISSTDILAAIAYAEY